MKSNLSKILLGLMVVLFSDYSFGQTESEKNSVKASATVQNSPAKITLNWAAHPTATSYTVYRKLPSASSWGGALTTLSGASTSYADNSVSTGTLYEYKIARTSSGSAVTACGYVLSGIETNLNHNKGIMILVIDNFFIPSLNTDINQLIKDYENDGWFVKKIFANRADLVTSIRAQIKAIYDIDPTNTKSIMLLGHVPYPYAGNYAPDGHVPDHEGAWPADGIYGDIDGTYTDSFVNNTVPTGTRNDNVPGDGKYDDGVYSTSLELQVGRVDFYDLPAFSSTETQLMKKYLSKLHSFKTRGFIPLDKAIVEDNFLGMGEGFAGSGYASFAPMVGVSNMIDGDYTTTLKTSSNLLSYGTGAGGYTSAAGIVTTAEFAADSMRSVFNMLFGSYFGDCDSQNNLLRASLASGSILSCSWSGRPWFHYHPMAMGEDLGYCAKLTQNNNGTYFSSTAGCWCGYTQVIQHGDPSLRLHYVAPPSNLVATNNAATGEVSLSWTASGETVLGYNVYRRDTLVNSWTKINSSPITATTYTDNTISSGGAIQYLVRATRLQTTASGTYYNLSLGTKNLINSVVSVNELDKQGGFSVFPNPFEGTFNIVAKQNQTKVIVLVSDVLGKKVLEKEVDFIQNEKVPVNISNVEPGIYFVTINQETFKVVKNK